MGKKSVNILRVKEIPIKHGAGNPVTGARRQTILVDSLTKVLTAADSGAEVVVGGSGIGITTLPAVEDGLWFDFIYISAHVHIINGGAGVIQGCVHHNTGATTVGRVVATDETSVTSVGGGASIGDRLHFVSDGTDWYVDGLTNAAVVMA